MAKSFQKPDGRAGFYPFSVMKDNKNNIIFTSIENPDLNTVLTQIYKVSQSGELIWRNDLLDNNDGGKYNKGLVDDENNYIFVGASSRSHPDPYDIHSIGVSAYDVDIVKINENGNLIFQKYYGLVNNESAIDIIRYGDRYLLLCNQEMDIFNEKIWLINIDKKGDKISEKFINMDKRQFYGNKFIKTENNDIFLVGSAGYWTGFTWPYIGKNIQKAMFLKLGKL